MSAPVQRYSTIVVGSGFGGAVAASTLVEAGESVLLLERGPWRDTDAVRAAGIAERAPLPAGRHALTHMLHRIGHRWLPGSGLRLFRRGLFDIHFGKEMTVVSSNGVGGGSHVYSAMNTRPARADYWDGHVKEVSSIRMEDHYAWMIERMGARLPTAEAAIPNWTPGAFADSPYFIADDSVPQPAMSVCMEGRAEDYRNNSYLGSANNAKATLDRVLLLPALKMGLQVAAEHECLSLWARPEGGYRLEVMDHASGCRRYLIADRVILAAGTLNTLRILFHSRALGGLTGMPALGIGFGGNGDSIAWWALNEAGADLSTGTPTHGRFALRDPHTGNAQPGPFITRFGFNGINTLPLPALLRARLRRDAILVAMGEDHANGVVRWEKGCMHIHYRAEANTILAEIHQNFREIARRSKKPVRYPSGMPITVHPIGGARLAACAEKGVVDGTGQIYGLPGLFVADAAALPAAPGTPPSMTIAAWSRHVALQLATTLTKTTAAPRPTVRLEGGHAHV